MVTHSTFLSNIWGIINKHWHILNISNTFGAVFRETLVTAFRKNTSLGQVIGANTINHNQKLLQIKRNWTKGEYIPCNTSCLSFQQIIATTTIESIQAKENFCGSNIWS